MFPYPRITSAEVLTYFKMLERKSYRTNSSLRKAIENKSWHCVLGRIALARAMLPTDCIRKSFEFELLKHFNSMHELT